jgi:hypothetical protein
MSAKAKIAKSIRNSFLYLEKDSSGFFSRIEKWAPKQKNKMVCEINALCGVCSHQIATANKKNSRTYFII